jgi:hypothetical protein
MKTLWPLCLMAGVLYAAGSEPPTARDIPRTVMFYAATGICFSFLVELLTDIEDLEKIKRMLWRTAYFAVLMALFDNLRWAAEWALKAWQAWLWFWGKFWWLGAVFLIWRWARTKYLKKKSEVNQQT